MNQILAALSIGLDTLFPGIPIYSEAVPNNLPDESFLIGFAGSVEITRQVGERYHVSGSLDITYLPPPKEDEIALKRRINEMYGVLALRLNVIKSQNISIRLRSHTLGAVDGELHDTCEFLAIVLGRDNIPDITRIDLGPGGLV